MVSGGALFALIRPLTGKAKALSRVQVVAGKEYASRSLEALGLSQEVRAFGVDDAVSERLRRATVAEVEPTRRALLLREMVTASYQTATILLLLCGLWAVHSFVDRPLASLGAIVVILVRALNQTASLQGYYHQLMEAAPFLERLDARAGDPPRQPTDVGRPRDLRPSRLRFESVSYGYEDDRLAVTDLDFEVRAGEAVGIVGPSGSGKSTLIQLLLRLRQPSGGRYLLDDIDAADIDDRSWFAAGRRSSRRTHG